MIITTTSDIPGKHVTETLGLVRGSSIRARHLGKDILATLRNIAGGEIHEYTKMLAEAREQSIDRMIDEAEALGAKTGRRTVRLVMNRNSSSTVSTDRLTRHSGRP